MDESPVTATVRRICAKDKRYRPEAYYLVLDALDYTARMLDKSTKQGAERHVTGKELLDGLRAFALQEFGPMALTVLGTWGVASTRDFGNIVFNLVEAGKLRKTEQDQPSDFDGHYDFQEVFGDPFLPRSRGRGRPVDKLAARRGRRAAGNAEP